MPLYPLETTYQSHRRLHWDATAHRMDAWRGWGGYYHRRLEQVFTHLVPPGRRVLELGCGLGDLLSALKPSLGVGVDFSGEMLARARVRHPELRFIQADAHQFELEGTFDAILLSDLVGDLYDVQQVFERLKPFTSAHTRVIINTFSQLWQLPLSAAEKLGLAKPNLPQNWLTVEDITNLLNLAGFQVIRAWEEILLPLGIPLLAPLANRWLVRFWPFKLLALTNFITARPLSAPTTAGSEHPSVSVIVPARNEAGNIAEIFDRLPVMGRSTELVFVEGHSSDGTYVAIEQAQRAHPDTPSRLLKQAGIGKGDAVRLGLSLAFGELLIILDADLTVPPESLPRFYAALSSGTGEFANGVRLVYPREHESMRFLNLAGNKLFSLAFTWMLGQPVKDTLCGTKAFWKQDYNLLAANRVYFGDFDPFGDFDLLFGAAKLNLKIVDIPLRYQARSYGHSNIQRWKHGWLLLRILAFAANRIKFI